MCVHIVRVLRNNNYIHAMGYSFRMISVRQFHCFMNNIVVCLVQQYISSILYATRHWYGTAHMQALGLQDYNYISKDILV